MLKFFQGGDNILVPKFSLAPHIHKSSQTFISNFRGAEIFSGWRQHFGSKIQLGITYT